MLARRAWLIAAMVLCTGVTVIQAEEPAKSPLQKLRERNPITRWDNLKNEAIRRQQAESAPSRHPVRHAPTAPMLQPQSRLPSTIQQTSAEDVNVVETGYQNTTSDPRQLKRVTTILPYADYQPEMHIRTDIDPSLQAPEEVALATDGVSQRQMTPTCFQWQASDIYHNPLYFEDPALERYGHSRHPLVQPFASVGRFGVQLVGLPYQMALDSPCKKMYTLGWYRPGECAPKQYPNFPWNTKAAVVQGVAVTGGIFLFP